MARKNFGLKNFFFSFATVVIAIYIFKNFQVSAQFMVAENGVLEDIIKAEGIIVKDEVVYRANLEGTALYYLEEGTKVRKGQLIAEINTEGDSEEIIRQIAEIQSAIDNKEKGEQGLSTENLTVFEKEIQLCILNNDLENMYNIVGQVNNGSISISSIYDDYTLAQLKEMKNSLVESGSTNRIPYYSSIAGIISYKTDGLEDIYKFENVKELTPSSTLRLNYTISEKKKKIHKDEEVFKIIRNFEYYIAATVDNEKAKLFEENKYVKVRILSEGEEFEVWGYIEKINYGSEQSVLILFFDDYFYKIYDKRYINLELITAIHEGIKIKNQALIEKDGVMGAYVQDASNIIKFFPVEILGSNEEYSIISLGDFVAANERRTITLGTDIYPTIKIFDKVILEPDKVYEGQIVD
ncbi:MAG TPA: hypothetical protein GX396_07870 [Tissierellia bacterium]|nr:hypothetical protein [Tissierellia bacterium]